MRYFILLLSVLCLPVFGAETILVADWKRIRTGSAVLQIPVLQKAVSKLQESGFARIIIRYPGGDAGNDLAIEMRNWLVALGIESKRIVLQPGSGIPDAFVIDTDGGGL